MAPSVWTRVVCAALTCSAVSLPLAPVATAEVVTTPFSRDDVRLAMVVFNDRFYEEYGDYAWSRKSMYYGTTERTKRQGFWTEIEAIETLIDVYEVTGDEDFKTRIRYLYHGFRDAHGTNWAHNKFNDDIIWGVIACIRAFKIFGDGGMKDMAIENFNLVWDRGWNDVTGGGIWWTTDNNTKNTCVNAPMAIAGMLLFEATGDASFRDRAHLIMDWVTTKLVGDSGSVGGALNKEGKVTQGTRTYTQGTYIGAASLLHAAYPEEGWAALAAKATDHAMNVMSNDQGILPDEYCDGQGGGDCSGFKGIFARWVGKYVKEQNTVASYGEWLDKNARAAWGVRNNHGVMWAKWMERTPNDAVFTSWETTSGVSMMASAFFYRGADANVV